MRRAAIPPSDALMNLRSPRQLALTRSAERLQTVDYAQWTAGTEGAIRAAIRDLAVGDAESEARVADVVFLRFQGHLVAIARGLLRNFSSSIQSRLPSASELAQEAFSDSPIRTRLIANLLNLRQKHGDGFTIRTLVKYVSQSAGYGFKDVLRSEARRILQGEGELEYLAQLQATLESEAREADENERRWELIEKHLLSRYQADELEVVLLKFQHGQSVREISETMRNEMPTSRFAGEDRKIRTFVEEVVKDLQAQFVARDHDL